MYSHSEYARSFISSIPLFDSEAVRDLPHDNPTEIVGISSYLAQDIVIHVKSIQIARTDQDYSAARLARHFHFRIFFPETLHVSSK